MYKGFINTSRISFLSLMLGVVPINASSFSSSGGSNQELLAEDASSRRLGSELIPANYAGILSTGHQGCDAKMVLLDGLSKIQRNAQVNADQARNIYCESIINTIRTVLPPLREDLHASLESISTLIASVRATRRNAAEAREEWNRSTKLTKKTSVKILGIISNSSSRDEIPEYEFKGDDASVSQTLCRSLESLLGRLTSIENDCSAFVTRMTQKISEINEQRGTPLSSRDIETLMNAAGIMNQRVEQVQALDAPADTLAINDLV